MRRPYPTKLSPYGPGSGVLQHLRGHSFINALTISFLTVFVYSLYTVFMLNLLC